MSAIGISSGTQFLQESARAYLKDLYNNPPIRSALEAKLGLGWDPSFVCSLNNHTLVCEASEEVYPLILRLRRAEMEEVQSPISVYCVCTEEAYVVDQDKVADLRRHGFGLFVVNDAGQVTEKFAANPIVQFISETQFLADVKPLSARLKRRCRESFDLYRQNSPAGVSHLSEVIEGQVMKAAKEAAAKGWITRAES